MSKPSLADELGAAPHAVSLKRTSTDPKDKLRLPILEALLRRTGDAR